MPSAGSLWTFSNNAGSTQRLCQSHWYKPTGPPWEKQSIVNEESNAKDLKQRSYIFIANLQILAHGNTPPAQTRLEMV
jgi:hypothetical protein